jgi:hypothetical protein
MNMAADKRRVAVVILTQDGMLAEFFGSRLSEPADALGFPTPTVSIPPDGTKGFPFLTSAIDLAGFGYTAPPNVPAMPGHRGSTDRLHPERSPPAGDRQCRRRHSLAPVGRTNRHANRHPASGRRRKAVSPAIGKTEPDTSLSAEPMWLPTRDSEKR